METLTKTKVTVSATIDAPVEKVWELWTDPKHIVNWNNASEDWYTPVAENDLRAGGKFLSRMEARDGSNGFDFTGKYITIDQHKLIEYLLDDDRTVRVNFVPKGNETLITETFEAEQTNSVELQHQGWQSILYNFKNYVEREGKFEVLHFETIINSSIEKVYITMLDEQKFREWTSEFNPSSHYRGSWIKGSKILFLGNDKDGNLEGMVCKIRENIPDKFVSIENIGIIQNGEEITCGPDVDKWAGSHENYTFSVHNGKTKLSIDTETNEDFKSILTEIWPNALKKLKSICEK